MEKKNKGTGLAVTSMILGIVGLVTSCVSVGGILCIAGLIFSIPALVRSRSGMAVAGLVTSIIGTIFFILTLSGIQYIDSLMDRAHENRTQTESSVDDNSRINYNQFIDSHKKLHSLKYKDLTFRYEAKQINFSDGYKLKL